MAGANHAFRQNDALKHGVFQKQHALECGARPFWIFQRVPCATSLTSPRSGASHRLTRGRRVLPLPPPASTNTGLKPHARRKIKKPRFIRGFLPLANQCRIIAVSASAFLGIWIKGNEGSAAHNAEGIPFSLKSVMHAACSGCSLFCLQFARAPVRTAPLCRHHLPQKMPDQCKRPAKASA